MAPGRQALLSQDQIEALIVGNMQTPWLSASTDVGVHAPVATGRQFGNQHTNGRKQRDGMENEPC
jgi:hypothetical protein